MIPKIPNKIHHFLTAIGIAIVCFSWNYADHKTASYENAFQTYVDSLDAFDTYIAIHNDLNSAYNVKIETDKLIDSLALETLLTKDKKTIREYYQNYHPYEDLKKEFDSVRLADVNFKANSKRLRTQLHTLKYRFEHLDKEQKINRSAGIMGLNTGFVIILLGVFLWIKADLTPSKPARKYY